MQKLLMKTFYGYEDEVPEKTIITPIMHVYKSLTGAIGEKEEFRGWWDAARCTLYGNDCLILHAPQGTAIADPLNAVGCAEQILFAGYCGSLNDSYPVGSIVHPGVSRRNGKSAASGMRPDSPVSLQQVESMTGVDYSGMEEDVVDMETHSFYEAAALMSRAYGALLLVTDMPKNKGSRFFEVPYQVTLSNTKRLTECLFDYLKADSMPS